MRWRREHRDLGTRCPLQVADEHVDDELVVADIETARTSRDATMRQAKLPGIVVGSR
jgi:hypothetical protein